MAYDITPAIEDILSKIDRNQNKLFDSHYVIKQLVRNHTDEYLSYAASIAPEVERKSVNSIHGLLAQEIGKCTNLVRDTGQNISTENIKGELSPCRIWEKIN
jgi:hypothetical protein